MRKEIIYIFIIAVLLVGTLFYWQRVRELSHRLGLIEKRIEESKKERVGKIEKEVYKAKVAIVIDDLGYNLNNLKEIWELDIPVTLSILPNLPYSKSIAMAAKKRNREVILHLPLEPYENMRLEKGTIMTDMTDQEIKDALDMAISSVPGLKGISNHMGSKATEDKRVMSIIFKMMKKDDLYFLDSLVTNKSVCRTLSSKLGIRFASRSVFLDNESDAEYIKGQIEELARQALSTDWAIGVGHDRALTIAVIKEMEPELKDMDIEVVPVSEIAK